MQDPVIIQAYNSWKPTTARTVGQGKKTKEKRQHRMDWDGKSISIHNNGNPFSFCPGVLATFVHTYLGLSKSAPFSSTYIHAIVFFNEHDPYDVISATRFFAIPSQATGIFDDVQFVMSVVDDANSNDSLIVTYGICDCMSGFIRIDRAALMDFAFSNTTYGPEAPSNGTNSDTPGALRARCEANALPSA